MLAQYAVKEASGEGAVSWDNGVRCVLPEVTIYGKAIQNGTPTPDAPVMPEFSAGTEVVSRGENLLDVVGNDWFSAMDLLDGKDVGSVSIRYAEDGMTFMYCSNRFPATNAYTLSAFAENERFTPRLLCRLVSRDGAVLTTGCTGRYNAVFNGFFADSPTGSYTFAISNTDAAYCQFGVGSPNEPSLTVGETVTLHNIQLELGTTATPYTTYFDGGTATAPELLAIPGTEYRDEWNPQTGRGVRRLHKFVMDGTDHRCFAGVHNTIPTDVFVVGTNIVLSPSTSGEPYGLTDVNYVVCNYFPCVLSYYNNNVGAFRHANKYYGLVAKFPYSMFGITKGEKTDEELLALVNAWLVEKNAEGNPLYYYYVMETPEEFQTEPQPLIQPKGTGQIIQTGGSLDGCPVSAKVVTHS